MKFPPLAKPGEPISARHYNDLLAFVKSLELRGGPGTLVSRSASGTTIRATAKGGSGPAGETATLTHPFIITDASSGGTARIKVKTGTLNDLVPTDVETNVTLASAGTWAIYLDTTLNTAGAVTAASVEAAASSQPADTDTAARITLGFATVINTSGDLSVSVIEQAVTHSLRFCVLGRETSGSSVTVRGTYNFWGV